MLKKKKYKDGSRKKSHKAKQVEVRNFHNDYYLENTEGLDFENNFYAIFFKKTIFECFQKYIKDDKSLRLLKYVDLFEKTFFVNLFQPKFNQQIYTLIKTFCENLFKRCIILEEVNSKWAISLRLKEL